jgi:hypothetical protein
MSEQAKTSGKPIFVPVDDTISVKTKPLSKSKNPIEAAEYHKSC